MLSIRASSITDKWLHDHLPGLPLLEALQLSQCLECERLTISNRHFKSLELTDCQHLVELKIDAPKLRKFLYAGVYLKYFSSNALALSQALYNMTTNAPSFELSKQNLYAVATLEILSRVFLFHFEKISSNFGTFQ